MHISRPPHNWRVSPRHAVAIQRRLAGLVSISSPPVIPRLVAGLDAAYRTDTKRCIAGAVLWDREERRVVESQVVSRPLTFPYVPGLLSFREAPALIAVLRKLTVTPEALLCDGQGIAHPRRLGIASHLGILTGLPSVGCAKSRLCGSFSPPGPARGDSSPLLHRGEEIGAVLRTRDRVNPVFVSPGHRFDCRSAAELVLLCGNGFRLPEPTRLADILVARAKGHPG